jgi:hypothetical protein
LNNYKISVKEWAEKTNAIGLKATAGRYGGTYAHKDIAFEFGMWISPSFKIYLIREFDRLKSEDQQNKSLEWNLQRTLSKINYRIHTDAIRDEIIPKVITKEQATFVYANEADLLNVALFGMTAKEWRDANPERKGNIRDYAALEQLVVLSNMEFSCKRTQRANVAKQNLNYAERSRKSRRKSINALLIRQGLPQGERLMQLNNMAITQMRSLVDNGNLKKRLNEKKLYLCKN